jgi:hypothetical protein
MKRSFAVVRVILPPCTCPLSLSSSIVHLSDHSSASDHQGTESSLASRCPSFWSNGDSIEQLHAISDPRKAGVWPPKLSREFAKRSKEQKRSRKGNSPCCLEERTPHSPRVQGEAFVFFSTAEIVAETGRDDSTMPGGRAISQTCPTAGCPPGESFVFRSYPMPVHRPAPNS